MIPKFKSDLTPFHKISNYANNDASFTGLIWKDAHLGLDIVVSLESYSLTFGDRDDSTGTKGHAKSILQKLGCLNEYEDNSDGKFRKKKTFAFPSEEEDLIQHITDFKKKLGEVILSD